MAWKNGGGTTSEIAVWPRAASFDAFVWRVSVAEIAQDGAFSDFPGVDRTIVLLSGAGMDLEGGPAALARQPASAACASTLDPRLPTTNRHVLRTPYVPLSFDGGIAWHARLADGPTHDFNLMVRRGAAHGALTVWREAGTFPLPADSVLLFVAHGTATLHASGAAPSRPLVLERFDSVQPDVSRAATSSMTLDAAAVVLVVGITVPPAPPGVADNGISIVEASSAATAS
ncbi:MAG: HutD/Ves family protein [Janthinobacterium lividum]